MRALIFGKGYVGGEFLNSETFAGARISDCDITKRDEVLRVVQGISPEVVINAAGKTNLEWCRDNKLESTLVNASGPLNVFDACKKAGAYFVHIGSGCIFEGQGSDGKGFREEDKPDPRCFYSYTKALADELLLKEEYDKLLILRIRQPFSGSPHPRNLITKVISYARLITSPNSLTYMPDLVGAAMHLIKSGQRGIFNVCNEGGLSPYEIAMTAKSALDLRNNFIPISKEELDLMDQKNKREHRVDTILNMDKLKNTGFTVASAKNRLREALNMYANHGVRSV